MARHAFLLLPFVIACSSSPPASQNDSGTPENDAATSTDADAAIPQKDAGSITDASSGDAALDPFVPHPPAGSTKCGSGTIDSSSAHAACTEPSWILDDAPQVDGGYGAIPRACDAVTIGAGEWQVWCTSNSAYVWARIPVTNDGALQDCHGFSLLEIDYGLQQYGNGGGSGLQVMTYMTDGTQIADTPPNDPQVAIASMTIPTTQQGGAMSGWILANLQSSCTTFVPMTVIAGFDATWK